MSRSETRAIAQEIKTQAIILASFIALIWSLELIDLFFLGRALDRYGIIPRQLIGLRGILFAPFLHGGLAHVAANTIPFLTLGWLVMLRETKDFFVVTAIAMLTTGLGTWLIGASNSIHVGASGIIFGYLGFLLFRGYFERRVVSIAFSIIVGLLYGGLIWGVLPFQIGISWEGHLFGFIGGGLAARLLSRRQRRS
ncbi:FIG00558679: hypothetical protein [uncultured Synechococcales cyanobacterium]|uniref:Peptidase S54 rhomboid domain-containing protein n=1 Tax=uncultured Synechococcales cyanobacterium TaxID=1936017 RepID=A0A6J4VTF5_9CYAN|nr:FIG00558679: hypothetical protein [uncultured Synechococcales cyanobacterium]